MVLLMASRYLARLVEQAGERVRTFFLVEHFAIRSTKDGPESGTHYDIHPYIHLEELSHGLAAFARYADRVLSNFAKFKGM